VVIVSSKPLKETNQSEITFTVKKGLDESPESNLSFTKTVDVENLHINNLFAIDYRWNW
jgi:hypothetical protein